MILHLLTFLQPPLNCNPETGQGMLSKVASSLVLRRLLLQSGQCLRCLLETIRALECVPQWLNG